MAKNRLNPPIFLYFTGGNLHHTTHNKKVKTKMRKILALTLIGFLMTGIASAQGQDIPAPGITPDSPLYMFEKMSERLALGVAQAPVIGSEELEAKVRANQAAETLAEARAMANQNKSEHVEKLMQQYSENMNKSSEIISKSNNSELKNRLRNVSNNQVKTLQEVEKKVPEQARKGVQKAIENSQRNQKALEKRPDNRAPRETPGSTPNTERPQNPQSQESGATQQNQGNRLTGEAAESPTGEQKPDQDTGGSTQDRKKGEPQNSNNPSTDQKSPESEDQRDNRP